MDNKDLFTWVVSSFPDEVGASTKGARSYYGPKARHSLVFSDDEERDNKRRRRHALTSGNATNDKSDHLRMVLGFGHVASVFCV